MSCKSNSSISVLEYSETNFFVDTYNEEGLGSLPDPIPDNPVVPEEEPEKEPDPVPDTIGVTFNIELGIK